MARRAGVLPEFSIFHEVGVATVPSENSAHGTVVGIVTTIVSPSADTPAPPFDIFRGWIIAKLTTRDKIKMQTA